MSKKEGVSVRRGIVEELFSVIYEQFKMEMHIVSELNRRIPESIKKIEEQSRRAIKKEIEDLDKEAYEKYRKFLESLTALIMDPESDMEPSISGRPAEILQKSIFDGFLFPRRFEMFIRDMSLVYLIAEFESFLQNVVRASFEKRPQVLATCKKSITFEELMKVEDIEEARHQILEKEVSEMANQDIEEIDNYFKERFNLNLSDSADWEAFKERFYRRNIIIHNNGIPNRTYRLKTGFSGKEKRMTVSQSYLDMSIELFDGMAKGISEHFRKKFE